MPTILVIDDDAGIRDFLDQLLYDEGYTVVLAYDGSQGLALLDQHTIDLVLCDVMMPGLNGGEVCQAIRRNARYHGLPVVLMSALADATLAAKVGANAYITKPFSISGLFKLLTTLVSPGVSLSS